MEEELARLDSLSYAPSMTPGERYLHDLVLIEANKLLEAFVSAWYEKNGVSSVAVSWPSKRISADDGSTINHTVVMEMPNDRKLWADALLKLTTKTLAYALLRIDNNEEAVKAIVETPHGSRSWTLRKKYRGDRYILDRPTSSDDVEEIGLLWKRQKNLA
jgi:hypothetical protein